MHYHVKIFVFQSKEKEGYPPEQYPQAPGYTPQAGAPGYAPQAGAPEYTAQPGGMAYAPQEGAPGYTAQPGGMAYAPQAGAPGYTQQGTVIVTQPGVVTYQQQPVPPSNLILSIFSCICCCWILGRLKFGLMSKDLQTNNSINASTLIHVGR